MMKPTIPFSDWDKLDIRVGKIIEVDDHPKADKLYVMKVDIGESEPRTIVAGLKKVYEKSELKNQLGIFIINLEPASLRGIKSEGMTLAAANGDDSIITLITPKEKIEAGSIIR